MVRLKDGTIFEPKADEYNSRDSSCSAIVTIEDKSQRRKHEHPNQFTTMEVKALLEYVTGASEIQKLGKRKFHPGSVRKVEICSDKPDPKIDQVVNELYAYNVRFGSSNLWKQRLRPVSTTNFQASETHNPRELERFAEYCPLILRIHPWPKRFLVGVVKGPCEDRDVTHPGYMPNIVGYQHRIKGNRLPYHYSIEMGPLHPLNKHPPPGLQNFDNVAEFQAYIESEDYKNHQKNYHHGWGFERAFVQKQQLGGLNGIVKWN